MKLAPYISQKKLNRSQAARQLGVTAEAVRQWMDGTRIPRRDQIIRLYRWSKGAIQPNDFYDLTDPSPLEGLPLFNGKGVEVMGKN